MYIKSPDPFPSVAIVSDTLVIVIKPLIVRFKLIDSVSFGGASKKDHLWFKKSFTAFE